MKEKKKKNKRIIYLWHPVLLRVYDNIHFQRLLASATSPIRANSKICSSPVLYTLASNPTKKGETSDKNEEELRLICSPLLVVSLWTEQSSPPSKNLLIKKSLTENEIEEIIVSELFRLICFTAVPEPFLCENIRRLINKTISKSVKVSILGDKNLSQTDFGLLVGLTREQMAHGASDPRNNPSSTKTIVRTSPMNMNIFDLVCSHGK